MGHWYGASETDGRSAEPTSTSVACFQSPSHIAVIVADEADWEAGSPYGCRSLTRRCSDPSRHLVIPPEAETSGCIGQTTEASRAVIRELLATTPTAQVLESAPFFDSSHP